MGCCPDSCDGVVPDMEDAYFRARPAVDPAAADAPVSAELAQA